MRILLISDIHSNLSAFQAVLQDAEGKWDYVWCLGDLVGYGPNPNECVQLLRTLPHLSLAGNHDWASLGLLDISDFNADARYAVHWTANALSEESKKYLHQLPVTLVIDDVTLVHASPRDPVLEYILDSFIAALNFPHFDTSFCFVGHSHYPIIYQEIGEQDLPLQIKSPEGSEMTLNGQRLIINPGSVGQPRDGNPMAAYALLDTETKVYQARRVAYDIPAVQKQMIEANFPERLIKRLETGN